MAPIIIFYPIVICIGTRQDSKISEMGWMCVYSVGCATLLASEGTLDTETLFRLSLRWTRFLFLSSFFTAYMCLVLLVVVVVVVRLECRNECVMQLAIPPSPRWITTCKLRPASCTDSAGSVRYLRQSTSRNRILRYRRIAVFSFFFLADQNSL